MEDYERTRSVRRRRQDGGYDLWIAAWIEAVTEFDRFSLREDVHNMGCESIEILKKKS